MQHFLRPAFQLLGRLREFALKRNILEMVLLELGIAIAARLGQNVQDLHFEDGTYSILDKPKKLFVERLEAMFNGANAHLGHMQNVVKEDKWKLA